LTRSGRRRPPGRTASPAGRFHVRRRWHVAGDARGRPSPRSPDVRLRPVLLDSRPEGPGMSLPRIEVNSIRSAGASAHSKPAALRHPCLRLPPTPSHGATGGPSTGMMCPGLHTRACQARPTTQPPLNSRRGGSANASRVEAAAAERGDFCRPPRRGFADAGRPSVFALDAVDAARSSPPATRGPRRSSRASRRSCPRRRARGRSASCHGAARGPSRRRSRCRACSRAS